MAESSTKPRSPSPIEWALLALLTVAVPVSAALELAAERKPESHRDLVSAARAGYERLWTSVDEVAQKAVAAVGAPAVDRRERFSQLEDVARPRRAEGWSLYLISPGGEVEAWGGAGLLHPLTTETLPTRGRTSRASLSAVSLLSIEPLATGGAVVAGISLPTAELPFELPGRAHRGTRWSVGPIGMTAPPGRAAVLLPETPALLIDSFELATRPPDGSLATSWRAPLIWLGAWLLVVATILRRRLGWGGALLAASAPVAWALAGGVALGPSVLLGATVLVAIAAASGAAGPFAARKPALWGVAGIAALFGVSFVLQRPGAIDLAESFAAPSGIWLARLVLLMTALTWLGALVGGRRGDEVSTATAGRSWAGAAFLVGAAMVLDLPPLAASLAAIGGALSCQGLAGRMPRGKPLLLVAIAGLAAFSAATTYEVVHRWRLRGDLGTETLEALAPPSSAETAAMKAELRRHFERFDLGDLSAGDLDVMDHSDLAFEVWRSSPLARRRAVSAVALRAYSGESSLFTFGIPLDDDGRPVVRSRERVFDTPVWDHALINEFATIEHDMAPWGEVEYWLLVRPGHRLVDPELSDVSVDLLQGGPSGRGAVQSILDPARYALYRLPDRARIAPWPDPPPLTTELLERGHGRIEHGDRWWWAWAAGEPDGYRVVFLPRLGPVEGLSRAGTHAVAALSPIAVLAVVIFLLRLPRRQFRRQLAAVWNSYSRRLVLLFSLLLLAPAVVVDVLALRALGDRLERQKLDAARGALTSAQRVLGEYAANQEPGISLDTLFDDTLMSWLASVLDHEVNLYWASSNQVWASSRPELFDTGLLPKRIPGEIYSTLKLRGQRSAARRQQTAGVAYTELYAPLALPGQELEDAAFFLSIPLMAQEARVEREIAGLRAKVVLATTLLVLLLVALGSRLAASFTAPLEEIIAGTQRIAAGAASLGLRPKEVELATLAEAIDRMAERIAEGRRKLVAEKQVVERMVENITAAVVSVDSNRRVLMQNHVAVELLGTEVGEPIETALSRRGELSELLDVLERSRRQKGPQTVTLPAIDDEEPREWSVIWVPLPGEGDPEALVVVEDVTEVVRGERLYAWAEMARMIAHEIKNPLTPIRLSAEHLREVRQRGAADFDRIFDQCTSNILHHVEELRVIASEFSTYSRIPKIERQNGDLVAVVEELTAGYQTSPPAGVDILFAHEVDALEVEFDRRMLTRALRNLFENAIRAVAGGGTVTATVRRREQAEVIIADDGPGVDPEELARVFDPYFSTHDTGTGLGLPIARRIIEEHGGEIHARNRDRGGLAVRVTLPIA